MFADILRSKRTLGWRTCLIVPELAGEMAVHRENGELRYMIYTVLQCSARKYLLLRSINNRQFRVHNSVLRSV